MWAIVPLTFLWLVAALVLATLGRWFVWWTFVGAMLVAALLRLATGFEAVPLDAVTGMSLYLLPAALIFGAIIWAGRKFEAHFAYKKGY